VWRQTRRFSALPARAAAGDQGAWDEIHRAVRADGVVDLHGFRLSDRDLEMWRRNVWLLLSSSWEAAGACRTDPDGWRHHAA